MSISQPSASNQRGQGLLEVIIGIGVIIAGTVGSVTLISATITAGRATNNQVVAASLAREGIEVVRNLRDTNWLAIQSNTAGITSFTGLFNEAASVRRHFAAPIFDRTANAWTLASIGTGAEVHTIGTAFTKTCGSLTCSNIFLDANGYYQKSSGTAGVLSRFSRVIELHPICRIDAPPIDGIADTNFAMSERIETVDRQTCRSTTGVDNEVLVGFQVVSTVRWNQGGTAKSYSLDDRLYNWKYVR